MYKKKISNKKRRIIWGAILVLSVAVFFVNYFYNLPPKTYRAVEGPSSDKIETKGVFKPGGYIEIEFSPGIKSLKGYNSGTLRVYPLYPGYADITETIWTEDKAYNFGKNWGSSMSGSESSKKTFKIVNTVEIPRDDSLAGKEIVLYLEYRIVYPEYYGVAPGVNNSYFENESSDMQAKITVVLADETLTEAELEWMGKEGGQIFKVLQLLAGIFFFLFFIALYKVINPSRK